MAEKKAMTWETDRIGRSQFKAKSRPERGHAAGKRTCEPDRRVSCFVGQDRSYRGKIVSGRAIA